MRDKEKRLRHLLTRTEIAAIQETHGTSAALADASSRFNYTHTAWSSAYPTANAGGVAIFGSRDLALAAVDTTHRVIIPGRAHALSMIFNNGLKLSVVNVHNYDLRGRHRQRIFDIVKELCQHSAHNDGLTHFLVMLGDFDFPRAGVRTHASLRRARCATTRGPRSGSVRSPYATT